MELIKMVISGGLGAAIVAGIFGIIQYKLVRADQQNDAKDAERKALRYIMLYIIEERCKEYIKAGKISLVERRRLHHWHEVYHDGLGGNGDADDLMEEVDSLPLDIED